MLRGVSGELGLPEAATIFLLSAFLIAENVLVCKRLCVCERAYERALAPIGGLAPSLTRQAQAFEVTAAQAQAAADSAVVQLQDALAATRQVARRA
jgi:hypothetical protein